MITTRDLFNYLNPARIYSKWLKEGGMSDGELDPNINPAQYRAIEQYIKDGKPLKGTILKGDKDE